MSIVAPAARRINPARPFGLGLHDDPAAEALASAPAIRVIEGRHQGTYTATDGLWLDWVTDRQLRRADAEHLYLVGLIEVVPVPKRDWRAEDGAWELGYEVGKLGARGAAASDADPYVAAAFAEGLCWGLLRFEGDCEETQAQEVARERAALDDAERAHLDAEWTARAECGWSD